MQNLKHFAISMESRRNSQAQKLHNKMGLLKRKNHVIQEMARVMLLNKDIPQKFWAKVVNTSCHIRNRIFFQAEKKENVI